MPTDTIAPGADPPPAIPLRTPGGVRVFRPPEAERLAQWHEGDPRVRRVMYWTVGRSRAFVVLTSPSVKPTETDAPTSPGWAAELLDDDSGYALLIQLGVELPPDLQARLDARDMAAADPDDLGRTEESDLHQWREETGDGLRLTTLRRSVECQGAYRVEVLTAGSGRCPEEWDALSAVAVLGWCRERGLLLPRWFDRSARHNPGDPSPTVGFTLNGVLVPFPAVRVSRAAVWHVATPEGAKDFGFYGATHAIYVVRDGDLLYVHRTTSFEDGLSGPEGYVWDEVVAAAEAAELCRAGGVIPGGPLGDAAHEIRQERLTRATQQPAAPPTSSATPTTREPKPAPSVEPPTTPPAPTTNAGPSASAVWRGLPDSDREMLTALSERGEPMSWAEVASGAGRTHDYVRKRARGLKERGLVCEQGGKFVLTALGRDVAEAGQGSQ